jgi:hypothetical protein
MGRVDRLTVAPKVLENPLDHRRFLDARNYTQRPAALQADLDIQRKHPLLS